MSMGIFKATLLRSSFSGSEERSRVSLLEPAARPSSPEEQRHGID
jgi:hypothetical protein